MVTVSPISSESAESLFRELKAAIYPDAAAIPLVSEHICCNGLVRKQEIPTPALLLDLDAFEANLALMARKVKESGKQLRPHAKAHKCVELARRQIASGACGVCVATVPEAELMA